MSQILASCVASISLALPVFASTFSVSGVGGTIPDNPLPAVVAAFDWNSSFANTGGTPWTSSVVVTSPVASLSSVTLGGLQHTWRGDLHVLLTDPAGAAYNLVVRPGFGAALDIQGDSGDYTLGDYVIADAGASLFQGAANLTSGTYAAYYNPNAPWNVGVSDSALAAISGPAGAWTLEIRDWANGNTGSLTSWTLAGNTAAAFGAFCAGDGSLVDHTSACPCGNNGAPGNGCGHSFNGAGASLTASGTAAANDVVLTSSGEPATAFTMFLQHTALGDTVFHDGVLCAGGTLVRLRGRSASGGQASFPNSLFAQDSTTTLAQRGGVFPGQSVRRFYSAWYRNASTTFCPPATANVSNGWVIDW